MAAREGRLLAFRHWAKLGSWYPAPCPGPREETAQKAATKDREASCDSSRLSALRRPSGKATGSVVDDPVSHPMFGDGIVTAVEAGKLTIEFKDGRVKQIVDYYVKRRQR